MSLSVCSKYMHLTQLIQADRVISTWIINEFEKAKYPISVQFHVLTLYLLTWAREIIYYIDTDEIPGFFLLLKIISSSRAVKILSFTCEDVGVAMVTNIILTFWNRKYNYYCLYFCFITLYPSFITFLWQAFCDRWPH